jgi:molecular chaperone DnaK
VITVPAYFNDAQRQATKDAGQDRRAQRPAYRQLEPTAAALAYGLDKKKDETIAVYDFGGGTFDISILEVGEGVRRGEGDQWRHAFWCGDDLDQRVIEWMVAEFKKSEGIDLGQGPHGASASEGSGGEGEDRAVDGHGRRTSTCRSVTADQSGPKHLQLKLTRAKFEQLVERPARGVRWLRCVRRIADCRAAAVRTSTRSCSFGGSTRVPKIQQLVKRLLREGPAQGGQPG